MVIDFAQAQARQVRRRVLKARSARVLAQAYELLKAHRADPVVAEACIKLRDAARRLEPF